MDPLTVVLHPRHAPGVLEALQRLYSIRVIAPTTLPPHLCDEHSAPCQGSSDLVLSLALLMDRNVRAYHGFETWRNRIT